MCKEVEKGNYNTLFPNDHLQYKARTQHRCPVLLWTLQFPGRRQPGCGGISFHLYALLVSKTAASPRGLWQQQSWWRMVEEMEGEKSGGVGVCDCPADFVSKIQPQVRRQRKVAGVC